MKKDKRVFLLLAVSYRKKYLIGLRVARIYVLSIMGKADSTSTCSGYWGYSNLCLASPIVDSLFFSPLSSRPILPRSMI